MNNSKFSPSEKRAITRAKNIMEEKMQAYDLSFSNPNAVTDYLRLRLGNEEREHFEILCLNAQNQLIVTERLFSGTINSASVFPREIVKLVLEVNANAVIIAHNHPSGTPTPSQADKNITEKIKNALALIDVKVLDHIIIAGTRSVSFAQSGII